MLGFDGEYPTSHHKVKHSIEKPYLLKGPLSGLKQFLTNESPLKIMKNAFYFMLKALSFLKY